MIIRLKPVRDELRGDLERFKAAGRSTLPLLQAGAKAVQVEISEHLRELQNRGNARGWPSRKFFAGGADSVERRVGVAEMTPSEARVVVADPRFLHRIEGGPITPKRRKRLAIPLTAAAYAAGGKGTVREAMPGLQLMVRGKALFLGIARESGKGPRGGKKWVWIPHFLLAKIVTTRPHPEEAPDESLLSARALEAMKRAARLLMGRE